MKYAAVATTLAATVAAGVWQGEGGSGYATGKGDYSASYTAYTSAGGAYAAAAASAGSDSGNAVASAGASAGSVSSGYGSGYDSGYGGSEGSGWVTTVLTSYETYCPYSTQFTHGGVTYTATEATTITVTNCPCTVSYPATTYSSCVSCSAETSAPHTYSTSAPVYSSPAVSTYSSPAGPGSTYAHTYSVPSNATAPVGTAAPSVAPTKASGSPIATFTGAANKAVAASGAGLAAMFGLVAYAL